MDYIDKLGVSKIINAAGTYTLFSSSTMPAYVQAAVAEAAKHPVRLLELQEAAGRYLAEVLRCEAALVTSGASAAITLGTAACLSVANRDAARRIPVDTDGMRREVIVQASHRYDYDHSLTNCGICFVEVETVEEYERAFSDRTVMAFYFNAAARSPIGREAWIAIAHRHGVPCLNDAAADVPPISNLWKYTAMGFDLVAFSGGKGVRGPQNTGLLLGRRDLVRAASENSSPHDDTVGRGMKVAKEQIVGLVAAVDWVLTQSDESIETECIRRADAIVEHLKALPSVTCETAVGPIANHVPHLLIRYDRAHIAIAPEDVARTLREGQPSIELNPATGGGVENTGLPVDENTIVVGVWMLRDGEEQIVGARLQEVLGSAVIRRR